MSFKSKRIVTSMLAGAALAGGYIIYALGARAPAPEDTSAWALAILIFIGISVAAQIVIQIVFHIAYSVGVAVKERARTDTEVERIIAAETAEDERDKLVGLKSTRTGYACSGIGFLAALAGLAFLDASAVSALHILLVAVFAGSLLEGFVSILLYERGVRRG